RPGSAVLRLLLPDGRPYAGAVAVSDRQDHGEPPRWMRGEEEEEYAPRWVCGYGSDRWMWRDDRWAEPNRTVADGRITWECVGPRTWRIHVDVRDYLPVVRTFAPRPAAVLDLGDVTLDPGITLRGRVTDLGGKPVPG